MPRIWRSSVKRVSPDPGALVPVTWDGRSVTLPEGANLAAALLETGVIVLRATPGKGTPRGPFCMMGACYDCLVQIDGVTRQACQVQVAAGMVIAPGGHDA